jgi:hypothetical protein
VLTFAHNVQAALEHNVGLAWPRPEHPILIVLGVATNDYGIGAARVSAPGGGARERIEIPDPEHGDLDLLRATLVGALLREWLAAGATNANAAATLAAPPAWFSAGLARHLGGQSRESDAALVYEQWSRGRLPTARALLADETNAAWRHPALSAVMVAWLLEQPDNAALRLLQKLAGGARWTPALLARVMVGENAGELALDESWDAWQCAVIHQVRQPGTTTPVVARAFAAQVLLYPADYGIVTPKGKGVNGLTPTEVLALPRTDNARAAALDKARQLRLFAAGRDAALRQTAEAYARIFDGFVHDEAAAALQPRLAAAEAAYRALLARVAKEGALRDPPPPEPPPPLITPRRRR